jgi:malate synthase
MVINALNSGAKTFMADFEGNLIWYSTKANQTNAQNIIFNNESLELG